MTTTAGAPRFFIPGSLQPDSSISLPVDVIRHLQVLRVKPGDSITLFNGLGGEFPARLEDLAKKHAIATVLAHVPREVEPPYRVVLAQGVAGGDKMDWLIEKSVELGVHAIQPLTTERCVTRLGGERAERRVAHWQAVVSAACEQCGRNSVPAVAPIMAFSDWISSVRDERQIRVLLSPRASEGFESLPATAPAEPVVLLIGPEGGLSNQEEEQAGEAGFAPLNLGQRVLRTETAGIATLAALATRWHGW